MKSLYLLETVLKNYDWGSKTLIPNLCDFPPSGKPVAELWMGIHAGGMSRLLDGTSLASFLEKVPLSFLSLKEDKRQVDFLFKVLAAESALSIQIHPTTGQAIEGFAEEEKRGVPLTAFNRTYKDKSNKAEMIYALTDFWALVGIRPVSEIMGNLESIEVPFWQKWGQQFKADSSTEAIKQFCYELHTYVDVKGLVQASLPFLRMRTDDLVWIQTLYEEYGEDIGIFSPLWMNVVALKSGESLFLEPTQIHAYLKGLGIELMANSDNVIRASLTEKFKDVREFMRLTTFEAKVVERLPSHKEGEATQTFHPRGVDFALKRVHFESSLQTTLSCPYLGIGIALGDLTLELEGMSLSLKRGQSVLIKASPAPLKLMATNPKTSFFMATWQN